MKKLNNKLKEFFDKFIVKKNAYKIVSHLAIFVIILSILSLTYVIDNSNMFNSLQLFTFIILSLYVAFLAGALWIFSKFERIGLIKVTFFKITALTVTIIGLLIIFQTLAKTQELEMMEIFFLLIGTAIPLTIGKIVWDMSKNTDDYVIHKVQKDERKKINKKEEFDKAQRYKDEFEDQ